MKSWKIVSGILSILASLLVLLSTCVACMSGTAHGMAADFAGRDDSLSALLRFTFLAFWLLVAGITSIVTSKGKTPSNIILLILYGIGAAIAINGIPEEIHADNYADNYVDNYLYVASGDAEHDAWAFWCVPWVIWCSLCAVIPVIGIVSRIFSKKDKQEKSAKEE